MFKRILPLLLCALLLTACAPAEPLPSPTQTPPPDGAADRGWTLTATLSLLDLPPYEPPEDRPPDTVSADTMGEVLADLLPLLSEALPEWTDAVLAPGGLYCDMDVNHPGSPRTAGVMTCWTRIAGTAPTGATPGGASGTPPPTGRSGAWCRFLRRGSRRAAARAAPTESVRPLWGRSAAA